MPGNPDATLFLGNLDERVDERLLFEIMLQAGPLVDVYIPRDRETGRHKGYAFAEFTSEKSAHYALSLFAGLVFLHGKPIRIAISGQDKPVQSPAKPVKERKDLAAARPLETSDLTQGNSPFLSTPPAYPLISAYQSHSGSTLSGQGRFLSPPVLAQSYNAHLVSLGEWGLRSPTPNHGSHRLYPSY